MDAVKFIKERKRMCNGRPCATCPLFAVHHLEYLPACNEWCMDHPEASVTVVEKWAEEHPRKTRQSEFLEQYPETTLDAFGVITICPTSVSAAYRDGDGLCKNPENLCIDCRRKFWMQEVE
jgi:hypothetical protein